MRQVSRPPASVVDPSEVRAPPDDDPGHQVGEFSTGRGGILRPARSGFLGASRLAGQDRRLRLSRKATVSP